MTDKNFITKTYEYKLRTNAKFIAACERALDSSRFVYNCALEQRISHYQYSGKSISGFEQQRQLTDARKAIPELRDCLRTIQVDAIDRLELAFKAFFTRPKAGFPRFKAKERYHTFSVKIEPCRACPLKGDKVKIPGVGSCRVRLSRDLPAGAKVKQVRVTRRASGWFVLLVANIPKPKPLPATGCSVGVDVGITEFAALSTGEFINNPRWMAKASVKLRRAQRRLSRKKRGSKNRGKAKKLVGLINEKIARSRRDFHHKVASNLVSRFDKIAVEAINVRGLACNKKLRKPILDAAWSNFFVITKGKAENAGREFIKVNPAYTSQTCSSCGERQKIPLKIRIFECDKCGNVQNRDYNAAVNILNTAEHAGIKACEARRRAVKQERG